MSKNTLFDRLFVGAKTIIKNVYFPLEYRIGVASGRRDPLDPPGYLDPIGFGNFTAVGDEFLRYFVDLCDLRPDAKVLDAGCGSGRMARPLTRYLKSGSYDGIDVGARTIAWCQRAYAKYPAFHFHHADIYNGHYNPRGKWKASEYRFPFADATFDLVLLASLFTHMLPADVDNYLSEIARVLKPGGHAFVTYFVLNSESWALIKDHKATFTFPFSHDGYFVQNDERHENVVGYRESDIRARYAARRLVIQEPIHFGSWCQRAKSLSFQDVVVAIKEG